MIQYKCINIPKPYAKNKQWSTNIRYIILTSPFFQQQYFLHHQNNYLIETKMEDIDQPQYIAQVLQINLGVPKKTQTLPEIYLKIDLYVEKNKILRKTDVDYYLKHRNQIHKQYMKRVRTQYVLITTGNGPHWIKQSYKFLVKVASTVSESSGWGKLIRVLASSAMVGQIFALTLCSNFLPFAGCIGLGIVGIFEGLTQYVKYHQGQITGKQFLINIAKIAGFYLVRAGTSFLGCVIGGVLLGPLGIFLGGFLGGCISEYLINKATQSNEDIPNPQQIFEEAKKNLQLPSCPTKEQIIEAKKTYFALYHPDKWVLQKQEVQKQKAELLIRALQNLETIQAYLKL